MPVIVVGADTPPGRRIVEALLQPGREVRAFVSDPGQGADLKRLGAKVAIGDVSDDSHIEGAAMQSFTAVLVTMAAEDDRERSFARTPGTVLEGWARAVREAGVTRTIWIGGGDIPGHASDEVAIVEPDDPDLVANVLAIDDVHTYKR